ncbi:glycosyltransferase family 4 protein [Desulfobacterales bacterium HSG16]|nr:glycosyltransferase family 4 protein [Desulfobacterales bacterium HSG16]
MANMYAPFDTIHNIGFISTRFAGTDGVSLETEKWADIFQRHGLACFYFAGELDRPPERSYLLKEAHFKHPEIRDIFRKGFCTRTRKREVTDKIHELKNFIKDHLYNFIDQYNIDILVPENAVTIPLNIPLGLAITEMLAETGLPAIAHHHDFFWERQEFKTNTVWDYLNMAFPPHLPNVRHVIINSSAGNQLSLRTGISGTIIPNVMDFDTPPPPLDEYASDVREALGIKDDELFILQPTRVVKRKGIEHAIELINKLDLKAKLVISHASGDEGYDYERRVKEYSKLMGVETIFVSDIIDDKRGYTKDGRKIYTLYDIYPHADLVTYPSNIEGFGNAFLEAVYFKKPVMVNRYSIYEFDIKPRGFLAVEIEGYVTPEAVKQTRKVLNDAEHCRKMVETNYEIAQQYYSYTVLEQKLMNLMNR